MNTRTPPSPRRAGLCLLATALFAAALAAQTPAPTPLPPATTQPGQQQLGPQGELGIHDFDGECAPPSTQQQIVIGVVTLGVGVLVFVVAVQLAQRRYIQLDRNANLGRHLGYSFTLLVTSVCALVFARFLTGCWHTKYWYWAGFFGGLWLMHFFYTQLIVRRS